MATWAQLAAEAPEVAAYGERLWPGPFALDRGDAPPAGASSFPVAYLATVRPDGGPRLHPFCPIVGQAGTRAVRHRWSPA